MSGFKDTVKKITDSPFFTFSRLPLEFIEKEKIFKIAFSLVCILMAVRTIVHPFVILVQTISSGYFNFGVRYALAFIFTWLAVAAACWLGFHLWWKRRKKAEEIGSSEFIVLPFFSEIIKTFGEWLGIMFGVIGAVGGLFSLILLGRYSGGMLSAILFGADFGANFGEGGEGLLAPIIGGLAEKFNGIIGLIFSGAVILGPVAGFLIIFVSRFFAERLKVLAVIANNTKETSVSSVSSVSSASVKGCSNERTEVAEVYEHTATPHGAEGNSGEG